MVLRYIFILLMIAAIVPSANALICGHYFMAEDCKDCRLVEEYIDSLNLSSNVTLMAYDVSNPQNAEIANMFMKQYNLESNYEFPGDEPFILFNAEKHVAGIDEIKECFHIKIEQMAIEGGNPCPVLVIPKQPDTGTDGGSGTSEDSMLIPGEPELIEFTANQTAKPLIEEEPADDESFKEKMYITEKKINELIGKKKKHEQEKIDRGNFVIYYILALCFLVIASIALFIKEYRS